MDYWRATEKRGCTATEYYQYIFVATRKYFVADETRNKNKDDDKEKEEEEKKENTRKNEGGGGRGEYRKKRRGLRQSDERQCRRKKGSVCAEAEVIAEIARLLFLLCTRTHSPAHRRRYTNINVYIYVYT